MEENSGLDCFKNRSFEEIVVKKMRNHYLLQMTA